MKFFFTLLLFFGLSQWIQAQEVLKFRAYLYSATMKGQPEINTETDMLVVYDIKKHQWTIYGTEKAWRYDLVNAPILEEEGELNVYVAKAIDDRGVVCTFRFLNGVYEDKPTSVIMAIYDNAILSFALTPQKKKAALRQPFSFLTISFPTSPPNPYILLPWGQSARNASPQVRDS